MHSHTHSTRSLTSAHTFIIIALAFLAASCTVDKTDLGLDLQDPNTLYHGKSGRVLLEGCTVLDDSLSTVGYAAGVFGHATYANLGSVSAVLFSQISIANTTGIALSDEVVIDSAVMTLVIDTVYPVRPDSSTVTFHVQMRQLAENIQTDSNYMAPAFIPESDTYFFDDDVTYTYGTDSIRLVLNESIYPVLKQTCTREDFIERVKGFSLKMNNSDNCLVTVNLAATATRITLFYHTANAEGLRYNYVINNNALQFMNYSHDYDGTPLSSLSAGQDASVEGSSRLYLLPLGGTKVRLNMQPFLDTFRVNHPTATIHHAELLLPTPAEGDTSRSVRITALKRQASGSSVYVTDANVLANPYTYSGFDGYYHRDKGYYRLRVTQHLQELLREGKDYGTELIVDARRSSAFPAVINGTDSTATQGNPIRIEFIFTE